MTVSRVIDLPVLFERVPTEPSQQVRRKWRERERRWRRKKISQSTGRRVKPRGCWGFQGADPGLENVGPVEDGGGSVRPKREKDTMFAVPYSEAHEIYPRFYLRRTRRHPRLPMDESGQIKSSAPPPPSADVVFRRHPGPARPP